MEILKGRFLFLVASSMVLASVASAAPNDSGFLRCDFEKDIYGNSSSIMFSAVIAGERQLQDVRMTWDGEIMVVARSVMANPNYNPRNPRYRGYVQFKMRAMDNIPCSPVIVLGPGISKMDPRKFEKVDASIRLACTDNQGIHNGLCVVRGHR